MGRSSGSENCISGDSSKIPNFSQSSYAHLALVNHINISYSHTVTALSVVFLGRSISLGSCTPLHASQPLHKGSTFSNVSSKPCGLDSRLVKNKGKRWASGQLEEE